MAWATWGELGGPKKGGQPKKKDNLKNEDNLYNEDNLKNVDNPKKRTLSFLTATSSSKNVTLFVCLLAYLQHALCNTCTLQHVHFGTHANCNTCNIHAL